MKFIVMLEGYKHNGDHIWNLRSLQSSLFWNVLWFITLFCFTLLQYWEMNPEIPPAFLFFGGILLNCQGGRTCGSPGPASQSTGMTGIWYHASYYPRGYKCKRLISSSFSLLIFHKWGGDKSTIYFTFSRLYNPTMTLQMFVFWGI